MATLKGQNVRILDGSTVYAEATNCVVTLTGNTDDTTTKDDVGMSSKPSIVSKGWQVQVDTLNVADVGALITAMKAGTKLTIAFDETNVSDNTTPLLATWARYGFAFLTDMTAVFNDREYSAKNLQFTGTGPLNKFSES